MSPLEHLRGTRWISRIGGSTRVERGAKSHRDFPASAPWALGSVRSKARIVASAKVKATIGPRSRNSQKKDRLLSSLGRIWPKGYVENRQMRRLLSRERNRAENLNRPDPLPRAPSERACHGASHCRRRGGASKRGDGDRLSRRLLLDDIAMERDFGARGRGEFSNW